MLFLLSTDLEEEILEAVTESVSFWTWDMVVDYFRDSLPTIISFALKVILALIVFFVGRRIIRALLKFVGNWMGKMDWDEGVKQFFSKAVMVILYIILLLIILGSFGITATSIGAIIASAGLSIGLGLQGTLSNFAGGILILLLKPFHVGDYIVEDTHGNEGVVTEISMCYTKLLTVDNQTVILPNGDLSNTSLTNVTQQERRKVNLVVGISYHSDLRKAKEIVEQAVLHETRRIEGEPYQIFVDSLGDNSVNIGLRVWVKTSDYWDVRWSLLEEIKLAFDDNGIEIPFPQVTVSYDETTEQQVSLKK